MVYVHSKFRWGGKVMSAMHLGGLEYDTVSTMGEVNEDYFRIIKVEADIDTVLRKLIEADIPHSKWKITSTL